MGKGRGVPHLCDRRAALCGRKHGAIRGRGLHQGAIRGHD
nr:MAG TPA_asm: hypothetical protein [Caudoviricetes sp.]